MNEVYRLVTGRERKIKDFTNARYIKEKNQKCKRKKVNEKKKFRTLLNREFSRKGTPILFGISGVIILLTLVTERKGIDRNS